MDEDIRKEIVLTESQEKWLTRMGGKSEKHVHRDERGLFILMFDPVAFMGEKKEYLPTDFSDIFKASSRKKATTE